MALQQAQHPYATRIVVVHRHLHEDFYTYAGNLHRHVQKVLA